MTSAGCACALALLSFGSWQDGAEGKKFRVGRREGDGVTNVCKARKQVGKGGSVGLFCLSL